MARHKDFSELQKAKGFPRKRGSRIEKQIAEAEKLAVLLGSSPAEPNDHLAPPAMLSDPRCAPALSIWREYVPRLSKLHNFIELDRHSFARFCIYQGEFVIAHQDILDHGYWRNVRTVSGDLMPRINPSVARRDTAEKFLLEYSHRFGLTPLDRFALFHHQAGSGLPPPGLFETPHSSPPAEPQGDSQPQAPHELIGSLDRLDSPPPDRLQ